MGSGGQSGGHGHICRENSGEEFCFNVRQTAMFNLPMDVDIQMHFQFFYLIF